MSAHFPAVCSNSGEVINMPKARKCDTAKYKKRRQREHLNSINRITRKKKEDAAYWARVRAQRAEAELIRLHDPRRLEAQKIVNILHAYISNDPVYKISQIANLFGVDIRL